MESKKAQTISETVSANIGQDTGFIVGAVVAWVSIDENGQEHVVVVYDGTLIQAKSIAEYAAERLANIVYESGPPDHADG